MHPHCTSLTVGYHARTRRVHTPIGDVRGEEKKKRGRWHADTCHRIRRAINGCNACEMWIGVYHGRERRGEKTGSQLFIDKRRSGSLSRVLWRIAGIIVCQQMENITGADVIVCRLTSQRPVQSQFNYRSREANISFYDIRTRILCLIYISHNRSVSISGF